MKKLLSKLPLFVFFLALYALDWLAIEPYIESKYLRADLLEYNQNTWKFYVFFFAIVYVIFMIFVIRTEKKEKSILIIALNSMIILSFLFFLVKSPINRINLIVNTLSTQETFQETYTISHRGLNNVSLYATSKESVILFDEELNAIEEIRKERQLTSLYDLKDKDTITIDFAKGYLDMKYFY